MLSSTLTHLQKAMQTKIYQLGHLLPVWTSSKLLAGTRHQAFLQEIQQLSALPDAHFRALYRPAINQYVEFVQVLPEESQSALGGLLNLGLARGLLGLRQFAAEAANKLDADPLVNYAIFTAALFFDVAKVISQQKISITDAAGNYLQEWYPYAGTMIEQNVEFYKFYPYHSTVYQALNHDAAALLARQLMPREGFVWLSSDLELFIDWLDALRGEQGQGGRRISRALSLIRAEDLLSLMKTLPQIPVELIAPKEPQQDDQFYKWLHDGLANGSIAANTNEALVHSLDDGSLYLNNEIFRQFQETQKVTGDLNKLAADFQNRFGLEAEIMPGKVEYAAFLMQRGTQKTIQVRNGMFAMGSLFLLDMVTIGAAISPLQNAIRSAFQQARQLPGVKQTVAADRRPDSGPGFKMR